MEPRSLLTGPTAVWIGQDGTDLVGPSSTLGPDGVQDIHIELVNLPAAETITGAQVYGYGGGEWDYDGNAGHWAAALVRTPGATTADLYVEPSQVETGRSFQIVLDYGDGTSYSLYFEGGTANPSLRMPADAVQATWIGQDGSDLTGNGPNVGPDGIQDVHVTLAQLSSYATVQSATVSSSAGETWAFGPNPQLDNNAELVVNSSDSTRADLYFNPDTNLAGQTLTIAVNYSDGTSAQTTILAGATNPALAMPAPAPVNLTWNAFTATWHGQDGADPSAPVFVHVTIAGLPAGSSLVSATLNDQVNASWYYSTNGLTDPLDGSAAALTVVPGTSSTTADLFFEPIRNETGSTLTLTLSLANGSTLVTQFAGGACDLGLLSPSTAATSVIAKPGDDLNALANAYGSVHLTAGTYTLDQPLVLNEPVTITADPGVTLLFEQGPNDPTWTTAIKLNAGHITLDGFSVRFTGPIRWTPNVSYSPAVIGTRDNFDPPSYVPVEGITITHLDVQSPPAATSWEAEPSLMRLVSAQSGTIADNTLQGGTIEFFGGPWTITGNDFLGTVADTYTDGVIAGHYTHDVTISDNLVEPTPGVGKTWRFLVLTQQGIGDVVQNNTVIGVGPMDNDTVPNPNASEVILTESYRLHFEGVPSAISADGWVVQIPESQNGYARTGDVLAILAGPEAGQWRTIAQALGPNTYLLSAPITPGRFAVSITVGGFVDETFQGNTVNSTGSSVATNLVLAGNQFGVQVVDNTFIGGGDAFALAAFATESPDIWGWSHAPFLGAVINGNIIQDSLLGGVLDVSSGAPIKSSAGRVYFSATVDDNTIVYTPAFLAQLAALGTVTPPPGIQVGDRNGLDPGELVLSAAGNQVEVPPNAGSWPTFQVDAGTVNGAVETNQASTLPVSVPPAPSNLGLVSDNGIGGSDGITGDTQLQFSVDPSAAGYEYSLTGAEGTYLPIATPSAFQPAGLAAGFDAVFVRAYNLAGARGPAAAIAFVDDPSVTGLASASSTPSANRASAYEYRIGTIGSYAPLGVAMVPDPSAFTSGTPVLQLQTVGAGGNVSTAQPLRSTAAASPAVPQAPSTDSQKASPATNSSAVPRPSGPVVPAGPRRFSGAFAFATVPAVGDAVFVWPHRAFRETPNRRLHPIAFLHRRGHVH
ncbi:MAG: hypothetical protein P4L84_00340 [Isosphaeraceae bacterium]|nr:hypothetical protein [Isosphaeraceae bacterium]